jgi:transcription elongation factor GreA
MENREIYLTPDGAEKIRKELELLRGPQRLEIAKRLRHAIEMGDLTENADYISAKEDQAFLEGKILELETILRNASVVEKGETNGVVNIGHSVVVEEEDGSKRDFTLVGVKEVDPRQGRISYESPIGKALLGKKMGDTICVDTPGGKVTLKILTIR